mmetsp:Transcript_10024/g.34935  ORF Transcript_10024/g.34935 Transcript_10024/m.34935 type:complete len:81 (+) Transcript_10024:3072-3314(+)
MSYMKQLHSITSGFDQCLQDSTTEARRKLIKWKHQRGNVKIPMHIMHIDSSEEYNTVISTKWSTAKLQCTSLYHIWQRYK